MKEWPDAFATLSEVFARVKDNTSTIPEDLRQAAVAKWLQSEQESVRDHKPYKGFINKRVECLCTISASLLLYVT